jgi:hypothetical protein
VIVRLFGGFRWHERDDGLPSGARSYALVVEKCMNRFRDQTRGLRFGWFLLTNPITLPQSENPRRFADD